MPQLIAFHFRRANTEVFLKESYWICVCYIFSSLMLWFLMLVSLKHLFYWAFRTKNKLYENQRIGLTQFRLNEKEHRAAKPFPNLYTTAICSKMLGQQNRNKEKRKRNLHMVCALNHQIVLCCLSSVPHCGQWGTTCNRPIWLIIAKQVTMINS